MTESTATNLPTVQLLHQLPDDSAHVDWLLAPPGFDDGNNDHPLIALRAPGRIDELEKDGSGAAESAQRPKPGAPRVPGVPRVPGAPGAPGAAMDLIRIADHRLAYLDYEGPISDRRGIVRRICRGTTRSWLEQGNIWDLQIVWDLETGTQRLQALRIEHLQAAKWLVWAI